MKRQGNEGWRAHVTASRISRRRFLKAAATATGAAVVSPYLGGARAFGAEADSKVVMGYGLSLVQLDPHRNENTVHESVLRNMYECLVAFSKDSEAPRAAAGDGVEADRQPDHAVQASPERQVP